MNYKQYLKTNHWKKTKEKVFLQKGKICKICESILNINIHHRIYEDFFGSILFREQNHELIPLCSICHGLWHSIYKYRKIGPMDYIRAKKLLQLGATHKQAIILCTHRELGHEWLSNKLYKQIPFPRWGNATC